MRVKQWPDANHLRIVTANRLQNKRIGVLECGGDGCKVDPFQVPDVLCLIITYNVKFVIVSDCALFPSYYFTCRVKFIFYMYYKVNNSLN